MQKLLQIVYIFDHIYSGKKVFLNLIIIKTKNAY